MREKFDKKNEDFDVQQFMEKVRFNVNKKYGSELLNNYKKSIDKLSSFNHDSFTNDSHLSEDIEYVQSNYDISKINYYISSHRPLIGRLLVFGRKLVNGEIVRYVSSSFSIQSHFNMSVMRILKVIINKFSIHESNIDDIIHQHDDLKCDFSNQVSEITELKKEVSLINSNLNKSLNLVSEIDMIKTQIQELQSEERITPWAKLYSSEIKEDDLLDNIHYHEYFIKSIKNYAEKSADGYPPKILEVGLGNATMSVYFSRDCYYDVYGIDNDIQVLEHNIAINRNLGGYAKFMLIDAFNLDLFKPKYFDVAFSQGTLEHFQNESIVQLIKKQLIVSKYVIFSVPSLNWPTRELGNERKMSLEEWTKILGISGLNVLNLEYYKDDLHIIGVVTE